jgi:hypothetical protein
MWASLRKRETRGKTEVILCDFNLYNWHPVLQQNIKKKHITYLHTLPFMRRKKNTVAHCSLASQKVFHVYLQFWLYVHHTDTGSAKLEQ